MVASRAALLGIKLCTQCAGLYTVNTRREVPDRSPERETEREIRLTERNTSSHNRRVRRLLDPVGSNETLIDFVKMMDLVKRRGCARYACPLILAIAGLLEAQDGAALYKERCASCHDSPQGRIPSIGAIKQMTGEAVYAAMINGAMKSQASGLSTQQLISLLVYIAPAGIANPNPAFQKNCAGTTPLKPGASAWGGWSPSVTNARYQDAKSAGLAAADVPRLKLKWAFNLGAVTMARGQPALAGNRVFVGTLAGDVYAIDATSGCIHWAFKATAGMRSGVTVGEANGVPTIFFGDRSAVMYALNADSGELLWKTRPVEHLLATATATPQFYKGVIYQGFASIEEAMAADPNAVCCSFRGSVVALDAATGRTIWESFTIKEPAKPTGKGTQQGPSGAAIWSTPTVDQQRDDELKGCTLCRHRRQLLEPGHRVERRRARLRSQDREAAVVAAADAG